MSSFGASGPAQDLYKRFNITPEAVVTKARNLLRV
jgi:transketolase